MKLSEFRKGSYTPGLGLCGIEIETETLQAYTPPVMKNWTIHEDRSLRNFGMEYVLTTPLTPSTDSYVSAMEEFEKFAKTKTFVDSVYTGLHVHLNMVDRTMTEIANIIVLYIIFEKVLTRYCGPDRDGNLFCLKTSDAEASFFNIQELFNAIDKGTGVSFIRNLRADRFKYSGLNIVPLSNLGSLEVRTHAGTHQRSKIERWVNILMKLYYAACSYKNPVEIVNEFKNKTALSVLQKIFGDYALYFDLRSVEQDVKETLYYASSITSVVTDWEKFGSVSAEPEARSKKFKSERVDVNQATAIYLEELQNFREVIADGGFRREPTRIEPGAVMYAVEGDL